MVPKPRRTIPRPPGPTTPTTHPLTTAKGGDIKMRKKRWVYDKPSLTLLLLLHTLCLVVGFVLVTEPGLNPNFKPSLWDKVNYLSLLTTPDAIPVGEWRERFERACLNALFGVAVVQAWFVARLNAYIQRASIQHSRIVNALKEQRQKGTNVGIHHQDQNQILDQQHHAKDVGSFIRQMESVSLTFLGLPFVCIAVVVLLVLFGAPLTGYWKATAILATHLSLLIALPLIHILGLPSLFTTDTNSTTTEPSTNPTTSNSPIAALSSSSTTTTIVPKATTLWTSLLTLRPNPTFLLPLYYPLIFASLGTIAATAVLALDWNTSYQTYPFPLLVGSLTGIALGDLYTVCLVMFG